MEKLILLFLFCLPFSMFALVKGGIIPAAPSEGRFIYALTLDGKLHALDQSSYCAKPPCIITPLWSVDINGPLLKGNTPKVFQQQTASSPEGENILTPIEPVFLVEPVGNGTVYAYLPGEALQKLPLTMKQLVEHSPGRLSDGTLYLGSRSSSVLELDLHGNILTDTTKEKQKVLLVGKNNLHLNIINPNDSKRWNSTLTTIEGVKTGFSDTFRNLFTYYKYYSSFNGVLLARSRRSRRLKWISNFGFPVVALYHMVELPANANDIKKLYTLRPLILETKHPWIQTGGGPDLVNIGEIESVLFVLPQNKFPIIDHFDNITESPLQAEYAVDEGREASEIINYVDDFDATDCFPGTPNFPECLKGSKFAYKPFPVPLLEGYSSSSFRKYLIAVIVGALITLITLKVARRRVISRSDSGKLKIFEDQVLGYGSHGTVVFKGEFDGRPVAVKRMLLDFFDVSGEVSLLQESDYHPNVIRYFYKESTEKFVNIALELCPMTLQDLIEKKQDGADDSSKVDNESAKSLIIDGKILTVKEILSQIISGLEHLHTLNIVHRDIKPGNILISSKSRVVLSDFGVSKKLAADQMSFQATVSTGTSGWRAPELILSDEAKSFSLKVQPGRQEPQNLSPSLRVTKAVDIFSAGCVFYYIQSGGAHPFGDRLVRDSNIIAGKVDLSKLGKDCDTFLLSDLIQKMLDRKPERRPSASSILNHPYFWPDIRRLSFLEALSDRLERDDRTLGLTNRALEAEKHLVFGGVNVSWHTLVDKSIWDSPEYRKYFGNSLQDLLRLIRNKRHHWQELPGEAKKLLKNPTAGYLCYFERLFPNLLAYTVYPGDTLFR
jgi:serine/threonine protein kinase